MQDRFDSRFGREVVAGLMQDMQEAENLAESLEADAEEDGLAHGERERELGFVDGIRYAMDKLKVDLISLKSPSYGGTPVSREVAQILLETGIPKGYELMCYEYGKCQDDSCPDGDGECTCWTGVYPGDLEGMLDESTGMLSVEYRHFELWK